MGILTIADIAERIGMSLKTVRRAVASGNLKSTKIQNKTRIMEEDFVEWDSNGRKGAKRDEQNTDRTVRSADEIHWKDISRMWNIDGWRNPEDRCNFTFVDLFSGAGGLSCGLVMSGLVPVASVEIMDAAVQTYRYNFVEVKGFDEKVETRDIRTPEVKEELYRNLKNRGVNLVVGGFPCQGFSLAGNRCEQDQRNELYKEMKAIVEELQPDFVVMENVEGLRSMLNGKVEEMIINDYEKIGYKLNITVLNSADYHVPQTRKRVIFIGNRHNVTNFHPQRLLEPKDYVTLGQAIGKYEGLPDDPAINHVRPRHSEEMKARLHAVPEGKSLYEGYSDAWKKSPWNKPSCTIKENHGATNIHPHEDRCLTARECAELQSFPEDFIFKGSKKWQLVQIGNAVPPLMGKAIGLTIRAMLEELYDSECEEVLPVPDDIRERKLRSAVGFRFFRNGFSSSRVPAYGFFPRYRYGKR